MITMVLDGGGYLENKIKRAKRLEALQRRVCNRWFRLGKNGYANLFFRLSDEIRCNDALIASVVLANYDKGAASPNPPAQ